MRDCPIATDLPVRRPSAVRLIAVPPGYEELLAPIAVLPGGGDSLGLLALVKVPGQPGDDEALKVDVFDDAMRLI